MSQELYKLLGIERSASATDIKRAYQKAALKHHPDKGGDEETFKKIQQAYEVLSDDGKRKHYDMTGQIPGDQLGPEGGGGGMPFPFPFDIGNLFGMFGQGGRPGTRPKGHKAPPKRETLKLSLAQCYFGHSFQIHLDRSKMCGGCQGSGAKRKEPCGSCGGSGVHVQTINMGGMVMQSQGPCSPCGGEGSRVVEVCPTCTGSKKVQEKRVLDVKVVAGIQSGETLQFQEVCSEVPEFEKAGDLHLTIDSPPQGPFRRIGNAGQHLEVEVTINLAEALLGTRVKLEGHPAYDEGLFVEIPAASFTDDVYAITGLGMPVKNSTNAYGDLYLRIKMVVKVSERKEIAGKLLESVQEVLGPLKRVVEVPEDAEVQKELFLSRLPA